MSGNSGSARTVGTMVAALALGYGVAFFLTRPDSSDTDIVTDAKAVAKPATAFSQHLDDLRQRDANRVKGDFRALLQGSLPYDEMKEYVEKWAAEDPAAVWAWYRAGGKEKLGRLPAREIIFRAWFEIAPDEAMGVLRERDETERQTACRVILKLLFSDDPGVVTATTRHLEELAGWCPRVYAFGNLGQIDVNAETIGKLMAIPASDARTRLLGEVAANWIQRDWQAATAWAEALPESERARIFPQMLKSLLGSMRPQDEGTAEKVDGIRDLLAAPENRALRAELGPQLVKILGMTDAEAGLQWASANLSGMTRAQAIRDLIQTQAAKDPNGAAEIVTRLPPGGIRGLAAGGLLTAWIETDPTAAMVWGMTETADGGEIPRGYWSRAGSVLGYAHKEVARSFLEAADSGLPEAFGDAVLGNLVESDPSGTLKWVAGLGEGRAAEMAGEVCSHWMESAPAETAAYLSGGEAPVGIRPEVFGKVAAQYFRNSPDDALAWTMALPGEARADAVARIRESIGKAYGGDARSAAWLERLK